ncbi:UDP-glycosyltransferase UGT5 [Procambarus clarkii]|uniref:UDP-glycosyltransferase UGT5 n=1 Tax=Procambarus clarkii TaxID=6728 RepID=UPI001E674C4F|nr:UDP-glycosyltransferase UGT5-like isoform X2 [Procambarus clarkii]
MKLAPLCVLVAAMAGVAAGELAPPERTYKILMLLPVSTKSHRNVFMPIAEALADRGHEIVMLTNHPKSSKHPNIHEVTHGLRYFSEMSVNMFDYVNDRTGCFQMFEGILPDIARELYKVPVVKDLYERRKEFDLIMVDHEFNEVAYPFVHEAAFVMVTTPALDYRQSAVLGNVLSPAYVPNHMMDYPHPYSFWHRFHNMMIQIGIAIYWRNWAIVPPIQKEISAQFPDLPPLLDLERNMSLALINTHFSISMPLPLLPSEVEVGGMHCRPASPLPQELESWITEAGAAGVIYFSLGSFTQSTDMPLQYRDLLVQAFRRLPQRVLWKYEGTLEDLPDNVLLSKWLPQQDILGHDNVKVFITHCGLLGLQEAIYHATPLLALPIFSEQPRNAMVVKRSGLGHLLQWEELTVDLVVDALTDIINNPKYKENAMRMSAGMRDQPTSPRDRAVFWTEYVIRHRGAPQLRSPAAQLSWVEFLMLDVLLLLHLALFLLVFILRRIFRVIAAKALGSGINKMKKE